MIKYFIHDSHNEMDQQQQSQVVIPKSERTDRLREKLGRFTSWDSQKLMTWKWRDIFRKPSFSGSTQIFGTSVSYKL